MSPRGNVRYLTHHNQLSNWREYQIKVIKYSLGWGNWSHAHLLAADVFFRGWTAVRNAEMSVWVRLIAVNYQDQPHQTVLLDIYLRFFYAGAVLFMAIRVFWPMKNSRFTAKRQGERNQGQLELTWCS